MSEGTPQDERSNTRRSRARIAGVALGCAALLAGAWVASGRIYVYGPQPVGPATTESKVIDASELAALEAEARALSSSLAAMTPRTIHIVVDTARNRLFVRKGDRVVLEAVCSTGSGRRLRDPSGEREWIFETPRGYHRVRAKTQDPVWTKPDWAFIEEAKPVPESWAERRDTETLGDYALYFGDGYMIHGTLYQRYLGRAITHGCIRLGDEDLKRVYEMTPVGAPIYVF